MNIGLAQRRATYWHMQRFPQAREPGLVLAKAIEELGEVATALNYDQGQNEATGKQGDVPAECADVIICLLALVGRWYPDHDVMSLAREKLDLLLTPGAHKSGVTR